MSLTLWGQTDVPAEMCEYIGSLSDADVDEWMSLLLLTPNLSEGIPGAREEEVDSSGNRTLPRLCVDASSAARCRTRRTMRSTVNSTWNFKPSPKRSSSLDG